MSKATIKHYFFIFLFIIALLEKSVWDLGANIEIITSAIILSSVYLAPRLTFLLTLINIIISDSILGNTNIFIFTWSGFLIPAVFTHSLFNNISNKSNRKTIYYTALGIFANMFFFIWTNFGVWLLDSWGMYSNDLSGLILCYIRALPFLKNQLLSSIVFIPLFSFAIEATASIRFSIAKHRKNLSF